ncbi:MAG: glutamate--tRNA ligase [Fusobacteriota bacterium]
MKDVRVRIAPSPTGDPHVGTAYIALFNYAFAKKNDGEFLLRIEDTDQTRSTKESEQQIFDSLRWLGLDWSEGPDVGGDFGPYRQSERFDLYSKYGKQLVEEGKAYYCFCTRERLDKLRARQKAMKKAPGYDGHCRKLSEKEIQERLDNGEDYVIRLKMPYEGQTIVKDKLRGDVSFDNDKIDDQVLLKSDGFPTYHLANVVDDHLMGISHVIRAEEWIASTPKHIQLYKAFGWKEPEWVHMPLLRNKDKTKISKRKNPVSLNYYRENGYLKEAMLNFLGLLGWSIGDNKEIFTLDEMVENFTFDNISLGGPVFDRRKLNWINNKYIKDYDLDKLTKLSLPYFEKSGYLKSNISDEKFNELKEIIDLIRDSANTLAELPELAAVFFEDEFELPKIEDAQNKGHRKAIKRMYSNIEGEVQKRAIKMFIERFEALENDPTSQEARDLLNQMISDIGEGVGKVLMPLRVVLTGDTRGPELYSLIGVIGKERSLKRVNNIAKKYEIFEK